MRKSKIERNTNETQITLELELDEIGPSDNKISTGSGFFDHMLDLLARHGMLSLKLDAKGDRHVDDHHLVEDTGIVLGQAIKEALGDKKGITRTGSKIYPMDETLVLAAIDISGRGMLVFDVDFETEKVGDFDTHLVKEFFQAVAANAEITLHIKQMNGYNSHHVAEACFKAFARTLREAISFDTRGKGMILYFTRRLRLTASQSEPKPRLMESFSSYVKLVTLINFFYLRALKLT